MKRIVLIVTIQGLLFVVPSDTIGGTIWSKSLGTFVPIFSVQPYSRIHQEFLLKQQEAETHNFQGRPIRITYVQKNNMIDFTENNTKISGLAGDVWNLLANTLNFTLKPIRSHELTIGNNNNGTYLGMLGTLQRNETDVIPRVEMFTVRYNAGDFTPALWTALQQLYIKLEYTYDRNWMVYLFSKKVWYTILLTYCVFTICFYAFQEILCYYLRIKPNAYFLDYCFHNFTMLCKEGGIPDEFNGKSRILELTFALFTTIIHISFSTLVFNYMTNKIYLLPFEDLISLINHSNYDVITANGSIPYLAFSTGQADFIDVVKAKRLVITPTDNDMFEKTCSSEKLALFTATDLYETENINICKLKPIGKPYYPTWIACSINRALEYKRTIDVGIIKLHEFGLISRLKARVKMRNMRGKTLQSPEPIDMRQVSLIFIMLSIASVLASIIFVFENLIYIWNCNKRRMI